MIILIFFITHWYLSLFVQTFFLHRYAAHQMYTMNRYWEKVFYFLTAVFQGSSYLSPKAYGIMHRLHHAYADTEKDPHSPKYSKNVMDMMWKTYLIYAAILNNKMELEEKFKKNVPSWNWMERVAGNGIIHLNCGRSWPKFTF